MGSKTTQLLGGLLGGAAGAPAVAGAGAAAEALTPKLPGTGGPAGPTPEDIEAERLKREEEDRKRREGQGRGVAATLATSPLGDTSRAPTAANVLLGVG